MTIKKDQYRQLALLAIIVLQSMLFNQTAIAEEDAPEYQGTYWRPGYTCRDLLRHNWTQYRNCRYYYRYYGRYY